MEKELRMTQQTKKLNAIRSGIVVIGAIAFGYLTLEIGFKPFLLKAQEEQRRQEAQALNREKTESGDSSSSYS